METNHELIRKLRSEGKSVRAIASEVGISKSQVQRIVEGMPYSLPRCEVDKALSALDYDRAKKLCTLERETIDKITELIKEAGVRSLPALINLLRVLNDISQPLQTDNTVANVASQLNNIMNLQINVNK